MIDFHSHILPQMDDGADNVEEALLMLSELKNQGVTKVVATPHYRGRCSVKRFLFDRQKSYEKLKAAMDADGGEFPEIILGAEIAISEYILQHHGLDRLCIEGTNYLMAEMPNRNWEPYLYHVLYTLEAQYKAKIMIAHIDRYYSSISRNEKILKLIEMQPVFQINTPALMFRKGKKLLKWLELFDAKIVFGTDCHNMDGRKPLYNSPIAYVEKKHGQEFMNEINVFGENIFCKEE